MSPRKTSKASQTRPGLQAPAKPVGELADNDDDEIDRPEPSCYLEEEDAQQTSAESQGDFSELARRKRKRRSVEIRNSVRLGVLLVGLVGVNVYVFFFNRHTAPRDVLNLQSTSKTLEMEKKDVLKKDAENAKGRLRQPVKSERPSTAIGASASTTPTSTSTSTSTAGTAIATPGAGTAASGASSGAPRPLIQIPFAPPDELPEGDEANTGPTEKIIGNSDTLGGLLAREGFGPSGAKVVAALSRLCDPKLIRGGQRYLVRADDQGTPEAFEYHPTAVLRYLVEKQPDGTWKGRKVEQAVAIRTVEAAGLVESSLYESVQKSGEASALVSLLVELFAWDVNFYVDTHPGDHWKVIVEKQYLGGQFYKYGNLLAAEYGGKVGTFRAFYWKPPGATKTPGKYYDERGQAITKTMLKTPLRYVRISSKFDRKRFHPILHVEKAHLGIDYAAPVGTPVWASASGRVVEAQMKRGSGNTVVIAHVNGLATRYYHLLRFARGLHPGLAVRQKDVIGYVGTTGLSTGPHLHFSLTKNGAFVDPSKMQVTRDPSVPDRAGFLDAIRPRVAALKVLQPAAMARNE
ncbi:MAG: hypothetical protein QOI66_4703 [Myxococcales bacterium]|nr:hypothetical protein [Myxococcales bacterium]